MEFHDSCYDIRDYYTLVTHTYRIEEIFNGEYQDNHIDLCFRTEFADEDKSHYRNTLVVADLSKDNITWGAFPLFKTIDGEWVTAFDNGLCLDLARLDFVAEDAESVEIDRSTWMNKKGMPFVYKAYADWKVWFNDKITKNHRSNRLDYRSPKQKEYYIKRGNKVAPRLGIGLKNLLDKATQHDEFYNNNS